MAAGRAPLTRPPIPRPPGRGALRPTTPPPPPPPGAAGSLNAGHSHPRGVEAAQEQIARFPHADFTIVPYENYVGLAERLCRLVPIEGEVRAAFFNSGAEAVE